MVRQTYFRKNTVYRIYFNSHQKNFSIQEKVNGNWKVTQHLTRFWGKEITPKVLEAGRQRAIATGKKNVHAFLEMEQISADIPLKLHRTNQEIKYNPKLGFYCPDQIGRKLNFKYSLFGLFMIKCNKPYIFTAHMW